MKHIITIFLIFWSVFFIQAENISNSQYDVYDEIPNLNKLPITAINRIFEDSEGFMWYGTINGLYRDDGYQIKVFRSDFNHRGLIASNRIECITEDRQGRIWFGTTEGLYCIDKKDYRVYPIRKDLFAQKLIFELYKRKNGEIWVSTDGTIFRFNADGNLIKGYRTYNGNTATAVCGFCEGRDGEIIMGFRTGILYRYDNKRDSLIAFPDLMRKHNPSCIIQDRQHNYYWLATWGDGVVRFDPSAQPDRMFTYFQSPSAPTNNVFLIVQNEEGNKIWGTSTTHLQTYEIKNGCLVLTHTYPEKPQLLHELIMDKNKNLWISGYTYPSFIMHSQNKMHQFYPLQSMQRYTNYTPTVSTLCDSGDGIFWINQERIGIFLYNIKTNEVSFQKDFPDTAVPYLGLSEIMERSRMKNAVWIVGLGETVIYRFAREGMNMRISDIIKLDTILPQDDQIRTVCETHNGRYLWIGTREAVYRHDLKNNKTNKVIQIGRLVNKIVESDDHTIWIATSGQGIYSVNKKNNVHRYLFKSIISGITTTNNQQIWLCSHDGDVIRLDPRTGVIKKYAKICGLNGEMVNYVMSDEFDHIWIGTNQKLIELNPHNNSFHSYQSTDSQMNLWRFIPSAYCKGTDGNIYIGGINGICQFTPSEKLEYAPAPVKTIITDITANGQSLLFDLHRPYDKDQQLQLKPDERNITIYFSSLNYISANKTRFAYRMIGIDDRWQYTTDGENSANYSHLPKGDYIFEVKSTDSNGQWSNQVASLIINRQAMFYETWWAFLIYILTGCAVIAYLIYWYSKRLNRKSEELWADSAEMIKMRSYLQQTSTDNEETGKLDKLLIDKAINIVKENIASPNFDVNELARAMNMSRSTLTRKLKAITGDTPLDFIRHIKMKQAKALLNNKSSNISEVATALGYQNRKYFTACFKEEFGITPSEYQKNHSSASTEDTQAEKDAIQDE